MSIRGDLATMSVDDLLDWAHRRNVAGVVSCTRGSVVRSIGIADGVVMWASSNRPDEHLGSVLVRSGKLGERALADALETRAETGVPLGKVLLMAGMVLEADLVAVLAAKAREAITELLTWQTGSFELVARQQPPSAGVAAASSIESCLILGRTRLSRLRQACELIGDDDSSFYVTPSQPEMPSPGIQAIADVGLPIDRPRLWSLLATGATVGRLTAACDGQRFAVVDTLATWVERGELVVDRRRRSRTETAHELAAGALGRLQQNDRSGALLLASQAFAQDPVDPEVRRVFAVAERSRVAEIARALLAKPTVPQRRRELDSLDFELTVVERELLMRIDGRWDLLSVLRTVPAREADALLAFARLADLGVVEL